MLESCPLILREAVMRSVPSIVPHDGEFDALALEFRLQDGRDGLAFATRGPGVSLF